MEEVKNKINWWKVAVYAIGIIAIMAIGFFIGRKTIEQPEPTTIYLPGDTVTIELPAPEPVKEELDTANIIRDCVKNGLFYELFPEKVKDSIIYLTFTKEDTAKVFNDWATKRSYSETIFDSDTLGKAVFNADVQFNRLANFDFTYTPMIKQTTVVAKKPKYSPFVGGGVSTLPSLNVTAGYFYDEKWGFSFTYQYDYMKKNNIFGAGFLIKF